MTELHPQSSLDVGTHAPAQDPQDAISGLRKMSTTAGVGSGDYVAINPIAIASTLLGLATVLVPVLGYDLLQIITIAAIVSAIVAWRQIRRSNGTQTGKGLALAGAVLAVLIGGGWVAVQAVTAMRFSPDTREIAGIIDKLGSEVAQAEAAARMITPTTAPTTGPATQPADQLEHLVMMRRHYHNAYLMFSDKFRAHVNEERFIETWSGMDNPGTAGVRSMEWNGHIEFDTDTGSGAPQAGAFGWLHFNSGTDVHEGMLFTKIAGVWEIDDIPSLFPPDRRR